MEGPVSMMPRAGRDLRHGLGIDYRPARLHIPHDLTGNPNACEVQGSDIDELASSGRDAGCLLPLPTHPASFPIMGRHAYTKNKLFVLKSFQRRWETADTAPVQTVAMMGQGPFSRGKIWSYLSGLDVTVGDTDDISHCDVLVVGRENIDEDALHAFLVEQAGRPLRICSQEMLLAWMLTGVDPNQRPQTAASFLAGHPVLQSVLQLFDDEWPGTDVIPSTGTGSFDIDAKGKGPLSHLGYKVGKSSPLSKEGRRRKLRKALQCDASALQGLGSEEERREWGAAESRERLLKMAHSIAAFCRNSRRKDQDFSVAIAHWEEDLAWLKETYYQPRASSFPWPLPTE